MLAISRAIGDGARNGFSEPRDPGGKITLTATSAAGRDRTPNI
jgi:hypothetical protein